PPTTPSHTTPPPPPRPLLPLLPYTGTTPPPPPHTQPFTPPPRQPVSSTTTSRLPRTLDTNRRQRPTWITKRRRIGRGGRISSCHCSSTPASSSSPPQSGQPHGASTTTVSSTCSGGCRCPCRPCFSPLFRPGRLGAAFGSPCENGADCRWPPGATPPTSFPGRSAAPAAARCQRVGGRSRHAGAGSHRARGAPRRPDRRWSRLDRWLGR